MTQYEMTESLAGKCDVTLQEAKTALETAEWNPLTATHLLEQEKFRRMQALNEAAAAAQAVQEGPAPEEASASGADATEQAADDAGKAESAAGARRGDRGFRNLGGHIRRLVACGNRNRFVVRKGDEQLLAMPVTALAILLVCAFWVCTPLLVIGLFAGCRYSFDGRELGRESVNGALDKAADVAENVKQAAARA